jgi:hypothetical protein
LGKTIEITGAAIANLDLLHAIQHGFVYNVEQGFTSTEVVYGVADSGVTGLP